MSCNSCSKAFTFLRKEKGCPGCGFSYCSTCLNHKMFVPKVNADAKVCSKCKNGIEIKKSVNIEPPAAYYKRLAASKNSEDQSCSGENEKDMVIKSRLENLKKKDQNISTDEERATRLQNIKDEAPSTSDAELHLRLARLKGVPVVNVNIKSILPVKDTKSEQEQVEDLMKEYLEQSNIDGKYKDEFNSVLSDIESRLQKLKGTHESTTQDPKTSHDTESEDEEENLREIIAKAMADTALDNDEVCPKTDDELPFCEICNEDATMRCLGCKYLFCKRCFIDHKDDDDGCNRYEVYKAPKHSM